MIIQLKILIFSIKKFFLDLSTKNKKYEETPKYMAIRKRKGKLWNKQADLKELFYSLIYLFKGNFLGKNFQKKIKKILYKIK